MKGETLRMRSTGLAHVTVDDGGEAAVPTPKAKPRANLSTKGGQQLVPAPSKWRVTLQPPAWPSLMDSATRRPRRMLGRTIDCVVSGDFTIPFVLARRHEASVECLVSKSPAGSSTSCCFTGRTYCNPLEKLARWIFWPRCKSWGEPTGRYSLDGADSL